MKPLTEQEPKIICGFAGIGKSTTARQVAGVVDLESTPFRRDWSTYARVAKHMLDSGYVVLVSCHSELREELRRHGTKYELWLPVDDQRDKYIQRYRERGSGDDFIELMSSNWDEFRQVKDWEEVILVKDNLLDTLVRQRNQGEME